VLATLQEPDLWTSPARAATGAATTAASVTARIDPTHRLECRTSLTSPQMMSSARHERAAVTNTDACAGQIVSCTTKPPEAI